MKSNVAIGMLSLLVLLSAPWSGYAEEREEFLVNDDGGSAHQNNPRIATSPGCGFVIVWVDKRNGVNDIFLQPYDADGYPDGTNVKVNDDTNGAYQNEAAVAAGLSGLYSTVWKDYRDGSYPFGPDIFFQPFDSSLSPVGANNNVTVAASDALRESPDIAIESSGGGLIVWSDYRNNNWDIYGQRFSADGSLVGANFKINDDAGSYQQHAPRVSFSDQGWYVVTWYDNRLGNDDIYFQRVDTAGAPVGVNVKVNTDSQDYRQAFPDVCAAPAGNFTIVWVDWRGGVYPANPDIYVRRYDGAGTPVASETKLNDDESQRAQRSPAIACDRMGEVAVVWADSTATSWDITGQMIDELGNLNGSNVCFSTTTDSNQIDPDVAIDGQYRYVAWADNRNGNWDVYAAIVEYQQAPIAVDPTALNFVMQEGGNLPESQSVIVDHTGADPRDFSVTSSVDWLTITPATGTTTDTVDVSVNTDTLDAGTYFGALTYKDTPSQDSNTVMSVRLDVIQLPDDTITVDPVSVETDQAGTTPIVASIVNEASLVSLPLKYVKADLTVDSVRAGPTLPGTITFSATVDTASGLVAIEWEADSVFAPGDYYLADLYFTAGSSPTTTVIDTAINDTLAPEVLVGAVVLTPEFNSGEITISLSTGVSDESDSPVPHTFWLAQNWPNPFNASTTIAYSIDEYSKVTLEVFNVLGQRIRVLQDAPQPAGEYVVSWDSRLGDGREAPSGVYFYRLSSGGGSTVRKMILLK